MEMAMKTITIPITLPEEIAEQAEKKGLLNPTSVAMLVCEALKVEQIVSSEQIDYPPEFDHRLKRLVDPRQYRKGKILGDIVEPLEPGSGTPGIATCSHNSRHCGKIRVTLDARRSR